jgi:ABC-type dipeptide/oligopeptide/nickel transport system permease component
VERYHFDEPLWKQYALYMGDIAKGDFGESIANRRPVTDLFIERFPRTAILASMAVAFSAVLAIPLGVWSAARKDGVVDHTALLVTVVLLAAPVFVLLTLAQYFIGYRLGWFPIAGIEDGFPRSYILPAFVVALSIMATNLRLMRTSVIDTLREDFVRTARAKGANERRVFGIHALRPAMIPIVTVIGLQLGSLLGGTIVTESIFNIPGVGFTIARAIPQRDNTIIVGVSVILVVAYLVINLVVDMLYAWLDPRIRYD